MPTLKLVEVSSQGGESPDYDGTARESELDWIRSELRASDSSEQQSDDSTLSGTFLLEALDEMRRLRQPTQKRDESFEITETEHSHLEFPSNNNSPATAPSHSEPRNKKVDSDMEAQYIGGAEENQYPANRNESMSVTMNESYFEALHADKQTTTDQDEKTAHGDDDADQTSSDQLFSFGLPESKESTPPRFCPREPGPMEELYKSKYQFKVKTAIDSYRQKFPGKLQDYHTMDASEREREQQRVMRLLQKLKITSGTQQNEGHPPETPRDSVEESYVVHTDPVDCFHVSAIHDDASASRQDDPAEKSLVLQSPSCIDMTAESNEKSLLLLTPPCANNTSVSSKNSATPLTSNTSRLNQGSRPSPVEIARTAAFTSPAFSADRPTKRAASMSGRRGTDQSRQRLSHLSTIDRPFVNDTSSPSDFDNIGSGTPQQHVFSSSQSPIAQNYSEIESSPREGFRHSDISFGETDDDLSLTQKTFNKSINDTVIDDQRKPSSIVYLKSGKSVHFDPLEIHHRPPGRRAPLTQTFPDPFAKYDERVGRRLNRMFKWLERRDKDDLGHALILSLSDKQFVDMILKLLSEEANRPSCDSRESVPEGLRGGTLVVARSKEDVVEWSRSFRENSALTIFDHSSLPLKNRKSRSAIPKFAQHGVVLTTFDAIKSADSTVSLDENGVTRIGYDGGEDEWFTSRSQSESVPCKSLSLLHQLFWRRVIFCDELGKKCFLAKPGTSRAVAATALASQSRFLFVIGAPEKGSSLRALTKPNKDALPSICKVLQSRVNNEAKFMEECFADLVDSSTYRHIS